MAREERSNSGGTFIAPFQGILSETSKEPRDGFKLVTYKDKEGNTKQKHVKTYSSISGKIVSFDYKSSEWNGTKINSWNMKLVDEIGAMTLQLGADTRAAQSFLKMLPNIDVTQEIKIATFPDKESGATVILAWQAGQKIDWAYTKESPNGMPAAVQRTNGKWDFGDVEDFLYKKGVEFGEMLAQREVPIEGGNTSDEVVTEIDPSDIPF